MSKYSEKKERQAKAAAAERNETPAEAAPVRAALIRPDNYAKMRSAILEASIALGEAWSIADWESKGATGGKMVHLDTIKSQIRAVKARLAVIDGRVMRARKAANA